MIQITFDYEIKGKLYQVIAQCKDVVNDYDITNLSLTFLDENDNRIKIDYDKDLFEDLESEAMYYLANEYYNPELKFKRT